MQFLSVIIPAYNEEERIDYCLRRTFDFFKKNKTNHEIIIVNDGSKDNTEKIVKKWIKINKNIRLYNNSTNLGKGGAIKKGFSVANGDQMIFMDADCSTDPIELPKLIEKLEEADVVTGSRRMKESILLNFPPLTRRFLGIIFNFIANSLLNIGVHDINCGFKGFKRRIVQNLLPNLFCNGFEFDTELLTKTKKMGFKIQQIPIVWSHKTGSKICLSRDIISTLKTILKLRKSK